MEPLLIIAVSVALIGICNVLRSREYFSAIGTMPEKMTSLIKTFSILLLCFSLYASAFGPVSIGPIEVNDWPWLKDKLAANQEEKAPSSGRTANKKTSAPEKKLTAMEYASMNISIVGKMVTIGDRGYYKGHLENRGDKQVSVTFNLIGSKDRNKTLSATVPPHGNAMFDEFMSKTFRNIWTGRTQIVGASY